ncbi:MAG: phenylalanine--tRNA ligase beta subunit-related protein [Thermoleophilia bacterium]
MELIVTDYWRETHPEAHAGLLVLAGVTNPVRHPALDARKTALERKLRSHFAALDRPSLRALHPLRAYDAYFRRFGKSYHVQLQLESIAHKGKAIPSVAALVEAMFMAELQNQLLTAGHDADRVKPPLHLEAARGTEAFTRLDGVEQYPKEGDMFITDADGIISCVLNGPDRRTRIRPETTRVLYTVYAPPGVAAEEVEHHLDDIAGLVALVAPEAAVEARRVVGAQVAG